MFHFNNNFSSTVEGAVKAICTRLEVVDLTNRCIILQPIRAIYSNF